MSRKEETSDNRKVNLCPNWTQIPSRPQITQNRESIRKRLNSSFLQMQERNKMKWFGEDNKNEIKCKSALNALGNAESDSADGSQVADLWPSTGMNATWGFILELEGSLANPKLSTGSGQMRTKLCNYKCNICSYSVLSIYFITRANEI